MKILMKRILLSFTLCFFVSCMQVSSYASILDFFNFNKKEETNISNVSSETDDSVNKIESNDDIIDSNIYSTLDNGGKEVVNVSKEILNAIKNIDFKKVVALSDYNGTYNTEYVDQFFDKYQGSKDIVKTLLETIGIKIYNIEKIGSNNYKVSSSFSVIDINNLISKISLKVGMDIIGAKLKPSENGNDIISIILKRIAEVINKDTYKELAFDYDIEYEYINGGYKLRSSKIISDIRAAIEPILEKLNIN